MVTIAPLGDTKNPVPAIMGTGFKVRLASNVSSKIVKDEAVSVVLTLILIG